jgi:RNA polymerase sigma-70 factor (ECF subfamily)
LWLRRVPDLDCNTRVTRPAASVGDDEAPLFARAARGDATALRALYDRFAGRALAVALRLLGARPEAEEIVQETFVEVWRRAGEFDGARGGAASWITAIARNRAIDRLRARGASERRDLEVGRDAPSVPTPLEDVEQRLERERVTAALAELPPEQRTAIDLAYFHGLTQREIAERTGEPLGTVKTRVRLAMEKLAARLGRGERQ